MVANEQIVSNYLKFRNTNEEWLKSVSVQETDIVNDFETCVSCEFM